MAFAVGKDIQINGLVSAVGEPGDVEYSVQVNIYFNDVFSYGNIIRLNGCTGVYHYPFRPSKAGKWTLVASIAEDSKYLAATSNTIILNAE